MNTTNNSKVTGKGNAPSDISAPSAEVEFGAGFIGCVCDNSAFSAEDCNLDAIAFAVSYGYVEPDLGPEESEDYQEALSEEADAAVNWLNEQILLPYCSFYFDDNSLFYAPYIDDVKENVGFVSSREQEYPEDGYEGEWLHVSDHGNATLYLRNKAGEDTEIWGVV